MSFKFKTTLHLDGHFDHRFDVTLGRLSIVASYDRDTIETGFGAQLGLEKKSEAHYTVKISSIARTFSGIWLVHDIPVQLVNREITEVLQAFTLTDSRFNMKGVRILYGGGPIRPKLILFKD